MPLQKYFDAFESRVVWIPFPDFEISARVLSDFQLSWTMSNIYRVVEKEGTIKRKQPHDKIWEGHHNELRAYYFFLLSEYKRRGLPPRHIRIDWKSPDYPYWWTDDLFFISQKVALLRANLKWYIKRFYLLSLHKWPQGVYYPYPHVCGAQKKINDAWVSTFKTEFSCKIKNVGVILAKSYNLHTEVKTLHTREEKLWKKVKKARTRRRNRKKTPLITVPLEDCKCSSMLTRSSKPIK